ncbi:MAG: hypothetical protein K8R58_04325 [Bacteroidales bacterium]|nr:hypothetical protein [Bacteroidales bacterium]
MKNKITLLIITIIAGFLITGCGTTSKITKMETKMHKKSVKMNNNGAFATVGIGIAPASRHDIGRSKAKSDALQKMSEAKRAYIESTVHDFREEIGADRNAELNDVFTSIVDAVSANILKGARIIEFDAFQSKANKDEGQYTYLVLLAITPEHTYQSLMDEFKNNTRGSETNLYQRYVDSEAKKNHDIKIKKFKEDFSVKDY